MRWLISFSSWKKVGVLLGLNFTIQAIILFIIYPAISPSTSPLDIQVALTPASVDTFLASIGESGRRLYYINESIVDMLFLLVYACTYVLLLIELFKSTGLAASRLVYLALLPFTIALADMIENFQILISLDLYPIQSEAVIHILFLANMAKHGLTAISLVVVLVLILRVLALKCQFRGVHNG